MSINDQCFGMVLRNKVVIDDDLKDKIVNHITKLFQNKKRFKDAFDKGEKVPDLAKEYGVWSKTIYNLLRNKINQPNIALELARVIRERDVLLKVVGELFVENKINKKK